MAAPEGEDAATDADTLPCQHHLFRLPADVVYLNCASRSPMLREVERLGHAAVSQKNEPWRIGEDGIAERLRGLFGELIGAGPDAVAITPSTSYAISLAAHNILRLGRIKPDDAIVVLQNQMSSNVYPWQRLAREARARLVAVPSPGDGSWTEALAACVGSVRNSGGHVAVIAVPHFLWTDGSGPVDLEQVGRICAGTGDISSGAGRAVLVVDATQSLGVVPIDVRACGIDWLACSVHKWLFGPYGLSFLYAAEEWCDNPRSEPIVHDEHNRAGADGDTCLPFELSPPGYAEDFQAGARRFDAGGRPNPILQPMVEAALAQVLAWQPRRLARTLGRLTAHAAEGARRLGLSVPARHAPHILGIGPGPGDVPPGESGDAACLRWADAASAHLKERRIFVSSRAGVLRVAPHVYNTLADIDALLEGLRSFTQATRATAAL